MADYKAIKGHNIQTVAGDPGTITLGDIWYSNITKKIRIGKTQAASWATGGNLNTGRYAHSAWGTLTAGLTTSGYAAGGSPYIQESEEYDGTSWTEGNNINSTHARAQQSGSMGTQTAAVIAAGRGPPGKITAVEEYNGTSWAEVTDLPTATERLAGLGTLTAGLTFGGTIASAPPPDNATVNAYEYNGTSWADAGDLVANTRNMQGFGTQTAGIGMGGIKAAAPSGYVLYAETYDYDGTTWTDASADLGTARYEGASAGTVSTLGLIAGGGTGTSPYKDEVETYDGTSWTEAADISSIRAAHTGAGTGTSAFITGGLDGINTTEEWTGESAIAATVTSS